MLFLATARADGNGKALVILTSASLQTQGMALVLSTQMLEQGAEIEVLLCDAAGGIALKSYEGDALKPRDVTPQQMLQRLMAAGAKVGVCALYLPNGGHTPEDLLDGVEVAQPPRIARTMRASGVDVFSF